MKSKNDVSYYLSRIEVYNWGGFSGFHQADIDKAGTAIIGQTGSGKTTLIDALMTLLTAKPSYSLASTGGHESDRDLISYIRGISGSGESADQVARAGKTMTAITAYFSPVMMNNKWKQGLQQIEKQLQQQQNSLFDDDLFSSSITVEHSEDLPCVALSVIFWIDSSSNQPKDRHNLWIFSQDSSELKDWLNEFEYGGKRGLKQWAKDRKELLFFDSKSSYLSKVQQFFDVGENAFKLLNRTVGLKQLNSIDDIFRDLVLDDDALFEQAEHIIAQFDDLSKIRHEFETAKKQLKALFPLTDYKKKYDDLTLQLKFNQNMVNCLAYWYVSEAETLWEQRFLILENEQHDILSNKEIYLAQAEQLNQQLTLENAKYHQLGGATLIYLQQQIQQQEKFNEKLAKNWQDYQQLSQKLALSIVDNPQALQQQKQIAEQKKIDLEQKEQQLTEDFHQVISEREHMKQLIKEIKIQYEQALKQKSNIPMEFEKFRQMLAEYLDCGVEQLSYVAELIEVKSEQLEWRGAIERAIGSHRLRLLVPEHYMSSALSWVNQRHNKLHVRLFNAKNIMIDNQDYFTDSFVHKLNFKEHELSSAVLDVLLSIDRHCVESVEDLQSTEHAMTKEGTMSNKKGWFDKQDQRNINENWLTGFDNKDLLKQLEQQLAKLEQDYRQVDQHYQELNVQIKHCRDLKQLLDIFSDIEFENIDIKTGQDDLAKLHYQYNELNSPQSELSQIKIRCEQLTAELKQVEIVINQLDVDLGMLARQKADNLKKFKDIQQRLSTLSTVVDQVLYQEFKPSLEQQFERLTTTTLDLIDKYEKEALAVLTQDKLDFEKQKSDIEKKIIRQMGIAKQEDTGELVEVGSDIIDLVDYLERLNFLKHEDLPSKQKRFMDYLNTSSTESVSQLFVDIRDQIQQIKDRIEGLNLVLKEVDFDKDSYLRLNTVVIHHPIIKEFEQAMKRLKSYIIDIKNENLDGHYSALQAVIGLLQNAIDKKNSLSSRSLLDARYRLGFSISIISRLNEQVLDTKTGSQRGSGGEKEIIASYILTASLSYALDSSGYMTPRFATIVLDEAFSKSSQIVAGRIVNAIQAFGLHPLFVTPNKEMRLLREHTKSVVLIHRKEKNAIMLNCSWEKLEEKYKALN